MTDKTLELVITEKDGSKSEHEIKLRYDNFWMLRELHIDKELSERLTTQLLSNALIKEDTLAITWLLERASWKRIKE